MRGKRIFIVEDERVVALDLENRIKRLGYVIAGSVGSSGEALDKIEDADADLVLMDITIAGDLDGIALADLFHKRYGLAVIFVTASSDEKTLVRVKVSNACGFIIKPFTDEELHSTIDIGLHGHELEARLRRSEEQYRRLFDDAPVGYHEIDLEGRLTRVNRTELEMLGYSEADMLGRPVWEFVRERDLSREAVRRKLGAKQISPRPFERNYLRRNGGSVPVLVQEYQIRGASGELLGIRSTIQDISLLKEEQAKSKRLEASLRAAEKLEGLRAMAGGLAHELNNQLMAIQGNAALALLNLPSNVEARGYLQSALSSCQRSSAVIKQLLVCAGMVRGESALTSLSAIVTEMLPALKAEIKAEADLRVNLVANLPLIQADAAQLRQLLIILVTNALEAVKNRNGVIQIETGLDADAETNSDDFEIIMRTIKATRGRRCYVSVRDNGLGMDDQTRARLFDPFFTTKGVGRGLGLSAALGIVKNHEADIKVKSVLGKGTTVRIDFACGVEDRK